MNTFLHSDITDKILGCAIAVHRELGPGLSEYSYQTALALEMAAKPLQFVQEPALTVRFRDKSWDGTGRISSLKGWLSSS